MNNIPNYYELLDVPPDATVEEIKRAYRRMARKYHPDLNPGDKQAEETFKSLVEAYDVLCDPKQREKYDEITQTKKNKKNRRNTKVSRGKARRSNSVSDYQQYGPDFNRFVEQTFAKKGREGNQTNQTSRRVATDDRKAYRPGTRKTAYKVEGREQGETEKERPRDVEARLKLHLEKAYRGGKERIRLEDGRSLEIDMPSGMIDGQQMRLRGQGLGGGDLYLTITITDHCFFKLQGKDVFCKIPVTPSEAVLGSAIKVPTLDGLVQMSVPKGVKSGQRLRLAGKGYPVEGERGDQLVEMQIVVPTEPSEAERELYEQLKAIETFNPRDSLLKLD